MLYPILKSLVVAVMRLLFRMESHDAHWVPPEGPVLLVSNHSSLLDPPLVGGAVRRQVYFLAKAELLGIPVFGWLIRRLNTRPVRRDGADAVALRAALRVLGENRALLVFPEGTRGEEGVLRPPRAGAGMLAVMSGASVVPVYVSGSGRAWPKGRRVPRAGKVSVWFGPPLHFARSGTGERRQVYEAASRDMMAAIARLRDKAVGADRGHPAATLRRLEAVGGAGAGDAQGPSEYIQGRNGRHGEG